MTQARTTSCRHQALDHHPQDQPQTSPHHPQAQAPDVKTRAPRSDWADFQHPRSAVPDPGERACACHQQDREHVCCEHCGAAEVRHGDVCPGISVPPAGALRPLARALLSVAVDVHAERREVRRVTCPAHEATLRMEKKGLRHPVRSPLVSGVRSPATPEVTPSSDASPHVGAAPPPPLVNSDCIGDCA